VPFIVNGDFSLILFYTVYTIPGRCRFPFFGENIARKTALCLVAGYNVKKRQMQYQQPFSLPAAVAFFLAAF